VPTPEQLESRMAVEEFLEKTKGKIRSIGKVIKSEWFGRPDAELQGWIERGRAIHEIEDTMGFQLITNQTEIEIRWAQEQLEVGKLDVTELRMYLRSLRFLKEFILTTRRNADVSSSVLAGRPKSIGQDTTTFVKNARVEGAN